MSIAGFNVSDKAAKESSSIEAIDLVVKLQSSKLLPCNKMMMVHHDNHHHHPLPTYGISHGDVDAICPTGNNNNMPKTSNIYDVSGSSDSGSCAAVVGARILQPFDISPTATSIAHTAFKSPGGMAPSLAFPFTSVQWKELERQAMIYKYLKASIRVPLDLLSPITGSPSVPVASHSALDNGALSLRFSSGGYPEPGRCRRTDGKKWRCSRDAVPDKKYCERHMYRGRPRSRKPVELPNKKTCHTQTQAVPSSSSTIHNKNASPSQFVGILTQPFQENQTTYFVDKPNEKAATFWPVSSWKEPREPVKLNSYANFNAAEDQRRASCHLFLNSEIVTLEKSPEGTPRGFIDAWSTGVSDGQNAHCRTETSVPSKGKLPLSSLFLSIGANNNRDEEMGPIHKGLGVTEFYENHEYASNSHLSSWLPPASWATSTPGGPLAEVLRPSKSATTTAATEGSSNQSSPVIVNGTSCSPTVSAISSPSGVLQRNLASLSDSSGSSSPKFKSQTGGRVDVA